MADPSPKPTDIYMHGSVIRAGIGSVTDIHSHDTKLLYYDCILSYLCIISVLHSFGIHVNVCMYIYM